MQRLELEPEMMETHWEKQGSQANEDVKAAVPKRKISIKS